MTKLCSKKPAFSFLAYALGVILYQLLTGHHPFREHNASRAKLADAICDTDPSPPSAALAAASDGACSPRGCVI